MGKVNWSVIWRTVDISGFENAIVPLDKMDFKVWNFMKKTNIKSMNILTNKYKNTVTIDFNFITYNS